MSGDSITAVLSAHTCTTNSNASSVATNNKSGINKPLGVGLFTLGSGFCYWQGAEHLKAKVNLGRVKSNAWHNVNLNVPFKYLRPEKYIQADRAALAELENLANSVDNPAYKKHANAVRLATREYNDAVRANNLARKQWLKGAQHTYAKQALQGAKFRTGLSRGYGGLLILAGTVFAGMAAKTALSDA